MRASLAVEARLKAKVKTAKTSEGGIPGRIWRQLQVFPWPLRVASALWTAERRQRRWWCPCVCVCLLPFRVNHVTASSIESQAARHQHANTLRPAAASRHGGRQWWPAVARRGFPGHNQRLPTSTRMEACVVEAKASRACRSARRRGRRRAVPRRPKAAERQSLKHAAGKQRASVRAGNGTRKGLLLISPFPGRTWTHCCGTRAGRLERRRWVAGPPAPANPSAPLLWLAPAPTPKPKPKPPPLPFPQARPSLHSAPAAPPTHPKRLTPTIPPARNSLSRTSTIPPALPSAPALAAALLKLPSTRPSPPPLPAAPSIERSSALLLRRRSPREALKPHPAAAHPPSRAQ